MAISRRDAIRISGSTLAGLSLAGVRSSSLNAQAPQAPAQAWPDSLVETPMREGFPASLPLNPDGSAPVHPASAAGPISDPLMWRTPERQTPDGEAGVVAIFTNRMLNGETPTIFGDGEQQRDFVYVGDVAQANVEAIEGRLQGAYNVGTGVASSVNEVTQALTTACGFQGRVEYAAERAGEVRRVTLDASKLASETGWQAKVALAEGLALTVAYQKARTNRPG